jgi:hypothetical protein
MGERIPSVRSFFAHAHAPPGDRSAHRPSWTAASGPPRHSPRPRGPHAGWLFAARGRDAIPRPATVMCVWLALLTGLLAVPELDTAALRDGDILLHTSRSAQAVAVAGATASPYTHVGIVERTGDALFVIEAVDRTRRTPLPEWLARGVGGKATALRHPGLDSAARRRGRRRRRLPRAPLRPVLYAR